MSFCEQLQKLGPGLLGKAIWGEKECPPGLNKGGGGEKGDPFPSHSLPLGSKGHSPYPPGDHPSVTQVHLFKTTCKIMSQWCCLALALSQKTLNILLTKIYS